MNNYLKYLDKNSPINKLFSLSLIVAGTIFGCYYGYQNGEKETINYLIELRQDILFKSKKYKLLDKEQESFFNYSENLFETTQIIKAETEDNKKKYEQILENRLIHQAN